MTSIFESLRRSAPLVVAAATAFGIPDTSDLVAQSENPRSLALDPPEPGTVRVATFNVALNRKDSGQLVKDLKNGDAQARAVATIVQLVKPDILLANEVDYSDGQAAPLLLEKYLQQPNSGKPATAASTLRYFFATTVNTGVPSGLDLNNNGRNSDNDDAWGFGAFPGQYGMAVYSKFPIQTKAVRTFQYLKWASMPGALRPQTSDASKNETTFYHSDEVWSQLRLSSKSHWDVPIEVDGHTLHMIVSHPTPPVFDGPEDRNGRRNHDEIRLLKDYVEAGEGATYIMDDAGQAGPLDPKTAFIIAGDLNSDPNDGSGILTGIQALLKSPRIAATPTPSSQGAVEASKKQGKANSKHLGDPAHDTGDFNDASVGNLRIDFVLPSSNLKVRRSGVFWPTTEQISGLDSDLNEASDHHLVWVDVSF
jgi:3-phytase